MDNANQLELNKGDNFIFAVDVSASMQSRDCPGGVSRIDYLKEGVKTFATEASKWDTDGIDVLTFGAKVTPYRNVTAETAGKIIDGIAANEGMTDTAAVIKSAYKMHRDGNYDQTVLFVATDGAPSDRDAVIKTISGITQELREEHEFAISFLTVGKIDDNLQSFLTTLDDALPGAKYDIVDVKALESVDFLAAFSGALHD
jgi:hypothetical protein